MSLQQLAFRHPTPTYALSSLIAVAALSPAPSLIPTTLLLSATVVFVSQAVPGFIRHGKTGEFAFVAFLLGTYTALSNLGPTSSAIPQSIPVLLLAACLSSSVAVLAIATSILLTRHTSVALEFTLPPVWSTVWAITARTSPLGRIGSWSPIRGEGLEAFSYLRQYGGTPAIDWLVASFAVLGAQTVENWIMEAGEGDHVNGHEGHARRTGHPRTIVASTLALLTLPSLIYNPTLLPIISPATTPFGVACILPRDSSLSPLEAHLTDTRIMASRAKVIVWPEGAVIFNTPTERAEALKSVAKITHDQRTWVAVSFEETMEREDPKQRKKRHNGMALVGPSGEVVLEYYKRHLVPLVESFSQTPSDGPSKIITLDLPPPPGTKKGDWDPSPNHTRPITVTASICLDLSFPLVSLPSRPGLILAPARTWDESVGLAMWNMARTRAEELGSTVLWCDGGEGGVSGLAGATGGAVPEQAGGGSWSKQMSLPYPLEPWAKQRTWYSWGGELLAIGGVWFILFASVTANRLQVAYGSHWQPSIWGNHIHRRITGRSGPLVEDSQHPALANGASHETNLIDV